MGVFVPSKLWQLITGEAQSTNVREDLERIKKLPDEEKIRHMDELLEALGATGGALAGGGLMSIPAAGAGAVAARNLVSRPLARTLGLKETPKTAGEEVIDTAKTFALNAAGEGIGRAVPTVIKAGKAVAKNAIKSMVAPTPEAQALKVLADKYGITLNLGQRSGRPLVQSLEVALDRNPAGTGAIREFRKNQYGQYEKALNGWLDKIHSGDMSIEEFSRVADEALSKLQQQFNQRVASGANATAKQLNPKPSSDMQTGLALRAGNDANLDALSRWANDNYSKFQSEHGARVVDLTPLADAASGELASIPSGQLEGLFPPRAVSILKAANVGPTTTVAAQHVPSLYDDISKAQAGKLYSHLDESQQTAIQRMAESMGAPPLPDAASAVTTPPQISVAEALKTRSELLQRARSLTGENTRNDRRLLFVLADAINDSMEKSLANTPGAENAFQEVSGLNRTYREMANKLRPSSGKSGNISAATIQNHPSLEQIPAQVAAGETMIERTKDAVSPSTVRPLGANIVDDPMKALRRNRFDATVGGSTVIDPATGSERISPRLFQEKLPDPEVLNRLYSGQAGQVSGVGKPSLVAREDLLFQSPLPRSVDAPAATSDNIFNTAFPKKGNAGQYSGTLPRKSTGNRLEETMQVFEEAGMRPQAERGYAQGLTERSYGKNASIGDERVLDPVRLERTLADYGETTSDVLGRNRAHELNQFVDAGKRMTEAERLLGNSSGTSRVSHLMGMGGKLLRGNIPEVAGEILLGSKGAHKYTDPSQFNWMFDPPEKLIPQYGSAVSGAVGRVATSSLPPRADSNGDLGDRVNDDDLGERVNDDDLGELVSTPRQRRQ